MRRAGLVMAMGLALLAGCSQCRDCPARHQAFGPPPAPMQVTSSLLFDPQPGIYPPDAFAYRSDWPATESYYSGGQIIFFREYFNDLQGRYLNPNYTYRRFETFRSGFGYR